MRTKDLYMEYHGEDIINEIENEEQILNIMKARVTSVEPKGTFDSNFGTLYKYLYTFEDGVKLVANHKKEGSNFNIGEEVEYEVKGTNDYGSWGSVKKPEGEYKPISKYGDVDWARKDRIIARQSSLKIALEFLQNRGFESKDEVSQLKELTDVAEFITNYVLSDSTPNVVPTPQKNKKVPQNANKGAYYDSSEEADLAREQQTAHLGSATDLPF